MATTDVFDVGDLVRLGNHTPSAAETAAGVVRDPFFNVAGAVADPATVTLQVQRPAGTALVYGWPVAGADGSLTREGAAGSGRFHVDVTLNTPGLWRWRLSSTGDPTTAEEGALYVRPRTVA